MAVGGVNITFSSTPLPVPNNALAWATYNDSILATGWSRLDIAAAAGSTNETLVAFATGALEGVLTQGRAYEFNTNNFRTQLPPALTSYIEDNWAWTSAMAAAHPEDELWYQVGLLNAQVQGMWAGFSAVAPAGESLPFFRFLLSTLQGDMDDLRVVFPPSGGPPPAGPRGESHCSVLLKSVVNASSGAVDDVLASHTTWSQFESMTRIWRVADLPFRRSASDSRLVPGRLMSFSSYPGTMHSDDDWYLVAPSGLLVTETTIENNNASLWQFVVPQTIPDWARNLAANRLAEDGASWVAAFSQYNSGTYNNAFSVVDAKRLSALSGSTASTVAAGAASPRWYAPLAAADSSEAKSLAAAAVGFAPGTGLLTKLEQMPGPWIRVADLSAVLAPPPVSQGFHSSYNRIMNPELFSITNQTALVAAYGPHFSYNGTARALIFDRLQGSVVDFPSLAAVMRHNSFQRDPEGTQGCAGGARSGSDAIAERGDLTPAVAVCVPGVGQQDEAGIDAKMASVAALGRAVAALQALQAQTRAEAAAGAAISSNLRGAVATAVDSAVSDTAAATSLSTVIESLAISGPTTEGQPPFVWSQSPFAAVPHVGQPDAWDFPWVSMAVDAAQTSAALPDDLSQVPAALLLPSRRVWW